MSDFINKTFWIPAFVGIIPLRKARAGIQYLKTNYHKESLNSGFILCQVMRLVECRLLGDIGSRKLLVIPIDN